MNRRLIAIMFSMTIPSQADDLLCLTDREKATASLYFALQNQAYDALDERLKTPEQINA